MLSYEFISKNIVKIKILCVFLFYLIGVLVYGNNENWDFINSVYFVTVTVTTVGYGYFHVGTDEPGMMWFSIFFILIGCPLALYCINEFARNVLIDSQELLIHNIRKWRGLSSELSAENLRRYKLAVAIISIFTLALAGTLFYSSNEGWTGTQAFYWVVCTMTTVGYGDLTVTQESTRIFAIFFILSVVTTYAIAMNNIFDIWVEEFSDRLLNSNNKSTSTTKFDENWIEKVLSRSPQADVITKERFILEVLMEINAINFQDIAAITKDFKDITSQDGIASKSELEFFATKMRSRFNDSEVSVNPLHSADYIALQNDCKSELHIV